MSVLPQLLGQPNLPKIPRLTPISLHLRSSFPRPHCSLNTANSVRLWNFIHVTKAVKLSRCCTRARAGLNLPPKAAAVELTKSALERTLKVLATYPCHLQCIAAAGVIAFTLLGLSPSVQAVRRNVFQRRDWDKSQTKNIITSYVRPLILWGGILVICRVLDPVVLSSERSQVVKDRFVSFLRSLSTVLTFAFCTARLTQQIQTAMMNRQSTEDARNRGIRFIGSAVSTSVWIAAVCLFMELLGFSTQKWLTAGGFGTVLLTLAGREIFTNFLSSVMIHATRPFVEFEWIQTKIDGQEVSGTVEHVGWWSPTVIRGEDREAVHIPNHKFTMSVVRNLSQKTHWRIKTHIGLSHLDSSKIHLIVADMRKVLSKHPQVEHRRLHRRVFFDNVDPVNQSLMIMVSCFVKTSHFEEYLSVKEIILLNLLKVISHHNARLATPIRTIQRIYDEAETRQSPFRNVSSEDGFGRPALLVEASAVATTDSGNKGNLEQAKQEKQEKQESVKVNMQQETEGGGKTKQSVDSPEVKQGSQALEGLDSMGLTDKDLSLLGAAFEKSPVRISEADAQLSSKSEETKGKAKESSGVSLEASKPSVQELKGLEEQATDGTVKNSQETTSGRKMKKVKSSKDMEDMLDGGNDARSREESVEDDPWKDSTPLSEEKVKAVSSEEKVMKKGAGSSSLEENLVLGVALAGSKRTLPLDDKEFDCSGDVSQSQRLTSSN